MRLFVVAALVVGCSGPAKPDRGQNAPPPAPAALGMLPAATPAAATVPARAAEPSWLGVRFDKQTTHVIQVVPGGPAEKAGIQVGDDLRSIDGVQMADGNAAVQALRTHPPGNAAIGVLRDGKELTINVALAPMPRMDDLPRQTLLNKPAPPFSAQPIQGAPPSLNNLRGQVVVLDFWATWCGPCEDAMPTLDKWQATYGTRGLHVVGISPEDEADIRKFLAEHPLTYTIARDEGDAIGRQYMRSSVPMLVVIDRSGVVRHVHIGAGKLDTVEAEIARLL